MDYSLYYAHAIILQAENPVLYHLREAMIKDEKTILFLEEHLPELAEAAVKLAYWKTLAFGNSVLECKNGSLVETHPDGTETIIKKLPPSTPVTLGQILEIP